MISLQLHHIAIICSNYTISKKFYSEILEFKVISEHFRPDRDSWKLNLQIHSNLQIELFSFPNVPLRSSYPEACGLRHIAFSVVKFDDYITQLQNRGIVCEPIRTDEYTGKRFTFFADPDNLPIELYEA